jgi:5-methylcytosine-specific restriction protein A
VNNLIENAFLDFDSGVRPEGYRDPKYWYVLNSAGKLYPAKAIWAMAINDRPGNFNTKDARVGLTGFEYSLIDTRVVSGDNFDEEVNKSQADSSKKRRERLKLAPKKPSVISTIFFSFKRSPDVVAEVLELAKGVCGKCEANAPFVKKSNDEPYLEVHHIEQLANGGDDTVENAIALCLNCHREWHYG